MLAVILASVTTIANAQSPVPPERTPTDLLRSDVLVDVAWGGFLAGEQQSEDAIPLLIDRLREFREAQGRTESNLRRHLLDALIRLEATVPPALVAALLEGRESTLALILAAREPGRHAAALMRAYDRWSADETSLGVRALAAGNLLCSERARGFAGRLLPTGTLLLTIDVFKAGTGYGGATGGFGAGGGFGDGHVMLPADYPPYPVYALDTRGSDAGHHVRFAPGPRPVFYSREEKPGLPRDDGSRLVGFGSSFGGYSRRECESEWLSVLTGLPLDEVELPLNTRRSYKWRGRQAYIDDAVRERDDLLRCYWRVVTELVESGALERTEASALAREIEVRTVEHRPDVVGPFPPLPPTTVRSPFAGQALEYLRSSDPVEVAWGAFTAGKMGMREAVPTLIDFLRDSSTGDPDVRRFVHHQILDALVLLGARPPPELIAPFLDGPSHVPALLLAARDPERNAVALLESFEHWVFYERFLRLPAAAVGDLLCQVRSKGFAAKLLPSGKVQMTIEVWPPGKALARPGEGVGLTRAETVLRVPSGFPPYPHHALAMAHLERQRPGSLALGPVPVWFNREVLPVEPLDDGTEVVRAMSHDGFLSRRYCELQWLSELTGLEAGELTLPRDGIHDHEWIGPEEYVEVAVRERDELLRRYWRVVSALVESGALDRTEASALTMEIEVRPVERRPDVIGPFPPLPPTTVRSPFK